MDLKDILGKDILADLSKSVDGKVDTDTISQVLTAALPAIAENSSKADSSVKRGGSGDRGITDVLFSLLGDNSNDVTQSVAESTGVSQNQVGGILTAAAPMLLKLLGSNSSSGNGLNMLSMITGLLGGKDEKEENSSDILSMVGGLLGGKDEKEEKEDNSSDILSMVGSLLGGKDEKEEKEDNSPDVLSVVGNLLGDNKDEKEDSKDDSLGDIVNLAASLFGKK